MKRWRQLTEDMLEYEKNADDTIAFWEDEHYMDMFEERSRIVQLIHLAHDEVKKMCIKSAYKEELYGKKTEKEITYDWCFLTVNPREDVKPEQFIKSVSRFHNLSGIEQYKYAFEQRGEEVGDYKGLHIHSIFRRTVKPYRIKNNIERVFGSLVGNELHMKLKFVPEDQVEKIVGYISGIKKDSSKNLKVKNDVNMREKYGLKAIYTC